MLRVTIIVCVDGGYRDRKGRYSSAREARKANICVQKTPVSLHNRRRGLRLHVHRQYGGVDLRGSRKATESFDRSAESET